VKHENGKSEKRVLSMLLVLLIAAGAAGQAKAADAAELKNCIDKTASYILKTAPSPQVGSIGGEWAVLGLARSGYDVQEAYYQSYYAAAEACVEACNWIPGATPCRRIPGPKRRPRGRNT
jgi:hypothetical protein